MANIVVYVSGSVAAFKSVTLVRKLQKSGNAVRVVMSPAATKLIQPAMFASLTHYPVLTDLWSETDKGRVPHVELADWTDWAIVAPASADIIAKLANGIADDPVSTTVLATGAPVIVVPAMNSHMLLQPATQRNIRQLIADGKYVMNTDEGLLAEGYSGKGRMPEPDEIVNYFKSISNIGSLANKKVIVTAGGTIAPLDPVRFIGNRSSGKMGIAIASAAAQLGADVTLITGNISTKLPNNPHIKVIPVETTQQMYVEVKRNFTGADALIMAAAVADFKPIQNSNKKIKKESGQTTYDLTLTTSIDILKTMGANKRPGQLVVGFAAETNDLLENAQVKLANKNADMIVANDVSKKGQGFNSDFNEVIILQKGKPAITWHKQSKNGIGKKLMDLVAKKIK